MFKHNFWPHTIVLMIIGSIIASVWTIKIAITNPVQDSNLFLENYHIADKNINKILNSQMRFESKYKLDISKFEFSEEKIYGNIYITEAGQKIDSDFQIIVTRPEKTEFDTDINSSIFEFDIKQSGRWLIYIKTTVKNLTAYYYLELDTRKLGEIKVLNPFISHKKAEKVQQEKEERVKELLSH